MKKQSKFIEAENQPLKKAYPEIQKRTYFASKKLKDCPLKNPFLLRIQPIHKHFHHSQKIKFITLIAQGSTLMAQINANVHKKIGLTSSTALFLTCGSELVCNRKTVVQMAQKNKQEDGIVYLGYADQDPFGGMDLQETKQQKQTKDSSNSKQLFEKDNNNKNSN